MNDELVLAEINDRVIPKSLENGYVLDLRKPTFAMVGQENEIVRMKYVWLVLRTLRR